MRDWLGGKQYSFVFQNGYEVSIIKNFGSYGIKDDKWELAIIKDGDIIECPGITDDEGIVGWLSDSEVEEILEKVKNL